MLLFRCYLRISILHVFIILHLHNSSKLLFFFKYIVLFLFAKNLPNSWRENINHPHYFALIKKKVHKQSEIYVRGKKKKIFIIPYISYLFWYLHFVLSVPDGRSAFKASPGWSLKIVNTSIPFKKSVSPIFGWTKFHR